MREGADSSGGGAGDDDGAAQTCVVAVVRGEEDVGVVQLIDVLQLLYQLFHHVVHRGQRLPPAGQGRCSGAKCINSALVSSAGKMTICPI